MKMGRSTSQRPKFCRYKKDWEQHF